MSPKCQIEIAINNISKEKAKVIEKALEPDNVNFPQGLNLTINEKKNQLVFCFSNEGDLRKLISTVDEVLEHVNLSMEVIK
ncbi:MAG: KEOPS complex subunit Pcc1 [Candidatus Nitrosopelagicus sp.]|jgi:tRNA threonylcarbamoyladenosine modification (KEOPS) complex  Pcc1 subunit|nr:KEOPS complex subunit Pcc1 [Candidatus Nitrosopelagicus sp.]MDP6899188.1 KEOPS complex subunit Pcc1 [Candidatus Nitrosopelagicus sp.]|tara:strand:+ start:1385 stop:1627 length:243 start_codon:yes stop_codon:yes gene_type:complete